MRRVHFGLIMMAGIALAFANSAISGLVKRTGHSAERLHIADLGNGFYRNPILHIDYSDPDLVHVDGVYYMTASSFNASPGLPILRSTDLVNWQLVNYALPKLVPETHFETPQHGNGVWAPNIRYHENKFWIFYPDPDLGIFVVTADDPAGEWSEPKRILAGKGLIDPTPVWDTDGKAYLIHAWAKSRAGFNNVLSLRQMSWQADWVSPEWTNIIDGNTLPGYRTLEGPKFYFRNGQYYIFAPAGGVELGWQSVFRADNIKGPYASRIALRQGDSFVNGPHQGAWVHTNMNEDWFIHFQSRKAYGRIVHLQPMNWKDGWPVIGEDDNGDGTGNPVIMERKPKTSVPMPQVSQPTTDEFNSTKPGIQWQWNTNPKPHWYSLTANPGKLRLYGQTRPAHGSGSLWLYPALLLQKLPAPSFQATTKLDLSSSSEQPEGGLILFGENYAWAGVKTVDNKRHLIYAQCVRSSDTCVEHTKDYGPVLSDAIELRVTVDDNSAAVFSYRTEHTNDFIAVGEHFTVTRGKWVGAKIGVFSSRDTAESQHLDFDYIRFTPRPVKHGLYPTKKP